MTRCALRSNDSVHPTGLSSVRVCQLLLSEDRCWQEHLAQLFETRYLRHDLADFLDLTEAIIFHTFFFGH